MERLMIFFYLFSFWGFFQNSYAQNQDFFTNVYNNIPSDEVLKADWGFSTWIERDGKVILFDTGTRPEILKENLKKLDFDPARISAIVISHGHQDHTGGLEFILEQVKDDSNVFLPENFNPKLMTEFSEMNFVVNDRYREIADGIWLTEIFVNSVNGIHEQALVLEKDKKLIVITGCAHPAINDMCESITRHFPDHEYEFVTGGFHLLGTKDEDVVRISNRIKELGFKNLAPSHCTGEQSIDIFRTEWGNHFVSLNLGDSYRF